MPPSAAGYVQMTIPERHILTDLFTRLANLQGEQPATPLSQSQYEAVERVIYTMGVSDYRYQVVATSAHGMVGGTNATAKGDSHRNATLALPTAGEAGIAYRATCQTGYQSCAG